MLDISRYLLGRGHLVQGLIVIVVVLVDMHVEHINSIGPKQAVACSQILVEPPIALGVPQAGQVGIDDPALSLNSLGRARSRCLSVLAPPQDVN